jgi:Macrocin-O-methyltransferase (TylF)
MWQAEPRMDGAKSCIIQVTVRVLKRWVRQKLEAAGYFVFNLHTQGLYGHDGVFTFNNSHFAHDPDFKAAYQRGVQASRGVDPKIEWRVHVALWAARSVVHIQGDFVECGVNAGFMSSAIMQRLGWQSLDKVFYLIDTFSGPVLSQYSDEEVEQGQMKVAEDAMAKGAYVMDPELARANFAEWPNVEIVQGVVPDVLEQLKVDQVAFLHLDMNCAGPERAAFEYFWNKLSPGGVVLLDDYAAYGYDASAKAIDEAAGARGAQVLSLPTGQGLIWKQ